MLYLSTRGDPSRKHFCEILLEGLAPDGGLYLPEHYPQVDEATLSKWRAIYQDQGYAALAFEVLSLYIDDIPAADLKTICEKTYTEAVFGTKDIVPLKELEDHFYLEALSNGPTLAFKDMAMQLLGNLFEYELARRGEQLNILGATSGDTGSAAEYAMRGKKGVRVFMTSPHGRMSPFQQAQMFSLMDDNIHNIAIDGVFDDCQDIVKAVSNDLDFKRKYRIGTVNSINWARLLAQVVYYFAGYFQATRTNSEKVSFTVPSGNFGNICAGHVARMMGLPVQKLVAATNENDVLDEFFRTGIYRVRSSADTHETSSPSMDISKASNFERFVFDLLGRDGARVKALVWRGLEPERALRPQRRPLVQGRRHPLRLRQWEKHARGPSGHDPRHLDALRPDDRHPHRRRRESGARASDARRADDRAGDRAADQVRRNHRRGAGLRARPPLEIRRHRGAAEAGAGDARRCRSHQASDC